MPRDGSGGYALPEADFVTGTPVRAAPINANFGDIETAIAASLARDGQAVPTANLPMGGFRHTGVGNGVARSDYLAVGQVQDGAPMWCGTSGGTANALTLTASPVPGGYVAGQAFRFIAGNSNTGAATVNVNSLGAKTIQSGGAALASGDITAGRTYTIVYDGTNFQIGAQALAAAGSMPGSASETAQGIVELSTAAEVQTGTDNTRAVHPAGLATVVGGAWVDLASATTTNIGGQTVSNIRITGTNAITGFGTVASGVTRRLRFAAALTLTHNATSLILPNNGGNIITAAGDTCTAVSLGGGNWIVVDYQRASGSPLQDANTGEVNTASNLGGGTGLFSAKSGVDLQFRSLAVSVTNATVGSGVLDNVDLAASWSSNSTTATLNLTITRYRSGGGGGTGGL